MMIERVGIIGGGQLGRMLTVPAKQLGFEVVVIDATPNCPAWQVGAEQILADPILGLQDTEAIHDLAIGSRHADVITWEIEHIPTGVLIDLADSGIRVHPSPHTLAFIQDKLEQKSRLRAAGIPTAPSHELDDEAHIALGDGPYVVKQRCGGFDGRGNVLCDSLADPRINNLGERSNLYVEAIVPFDKEVALITARDRFGAVTTYPLVETVHKDNICHIVMSPAEVSPRVAANANEIGRETLRLLDGAGVFAIEMFVSGDDVLVNEIAPRVHNSGHHTIEANVTSQFEQHIRAVTGMPLGSTEQRAPAAVMVNILGTQTGELNRAGLDNVLALPNTHPHLYGKSTRPARKVGHITVLSETINYARQIAEQARKELAQI